jgi:hypothetical protein
MLPPGEIVKWILQCFWSVLREAICLTGIVAAVPIKAEVAGSSSAG